MPEMSRRQVLALGAGVGAAIALPLRTAAAAQVNGERLLANALEIFAGTEKTNAMPAVAGKIAAIVKAARDRLADLDGAGEGELFKGLPLGENDVNLRQSYQYLYEIALATRTPRSELAGDEAAQAKVIEGLVLLHERYYGDQAKGYYGNWHNWEIAISTHVSLTLMLLAERLAGEKPELTKAYVESMDAYLRNGKDGDVDLDSRFHTGANLADITANRMLQGALLGDDGRIEKAISDQATAYETIDPYDLKHGVTDGYYADGSFIQHHSVAYTGSYGRALLSRVVQTIKMLDGAAAGSDDLPAVVFGWVADGFAPLIFEGWMMEVVKGRAVSRTTTGYADVAKVVEAITDLTGYMGSGRLKSYVKFLSNAAKPDPASFVSPVSIARYTEIAGDDAVMPADLNPAEASIAFNAMDRTVHRRPGYAFALARSSERISKYEYMSGENLMPWFQGDGAYYLYLAGEDQSQAFGVDYYTTVSPYRLAGVTAPVEKRMTIPELYGRLWYENPDHPLNFTSSSESQNKYVYFPRATAVLSGGVTLASYGCAALIQSDDVAYADRDILPEDFVVYRNASAVKSWILLDDEIVVLVAGAAGQGGRDAVTAVDSRIAAPGDDVVVSKDGGERPKWVHYANRTRKTSVGYVFLSEPPVTSGLEEVTRSRRIVRTSNPDENVTKKVFTLEVPHPAGGDVTSAAYALVPGATEDRLRDYTGGPVQVIANNRRIQAVSHSGLGIVAANSFTSGSHHADRVVIDGPASVIVRERGRDEISIALSDPTTKRDRVAVTIRGRTLEPVSADDGVTVRRAAGGTRIEARTHHAYGRSFTAVLRPR